MGMAVQQLYVRLQQLQGTLAILRSAKNELVEQVRNATSTTTLRSHLGAVDQRNELEPTTTEESSTPRLNKTLSTQMYHIIVMMKTLYRYHNEGVNEEFARRRQFVREWEPRFVGLLRNVLPCRKTTYRPADERTRTRESIIGDCDRRHHDRCECAEDGRRANQGLSHPGEHRDRELDNDAKGSSRSREHNSTLTLPCRPK